MQRVQEHQERRVVGAVRKTAKSEVQVALTKYRGRWFGDVRLFVLDRRGAWIATRRGTTFDVDQLDELEAAVAKLRQAVGKTATP